MLCYEVFCDFEGNLSILAGIRVSQNTQTGKSSLPLGSFEGIRSVAFDKKFPPHVLVTKIGDKQLRRIFSAKIKDITPENQNPFRVLGALKPGENEGEAVLLRVLSKHPRTPPLIWDIECVRGGELVADGYVEDNFGNAHPDQLFILQPGAKLFCQTRAGNWLLEPSSGMVQVFHLAEKLSSYS